MRKSFFAVALFLSTALGLNLNAQNALSFTRIERNPRTSAFAGAGMASTGNGWYTAYENAAQLGYAESKIDAGVGVQLWEMSNDADKATHFHAGGAYRSGSFGVAVGGVFQMGEPLGTFTPNDYMVSLGLAYRVADKVSVGVNARYAAQNLTRDYSVSGFSADVTVMGRISPALSVAAGVANLGNKVQGSADSFSQPAFAHAGLAWKAIDNGVHALEVVMDAEYNFDGSVAAAIGSEYTYNHLVYVRTGYRLAAEKALVPSHFAIGLGARVGSFRVEGSYLTASPVLGNTLNIGVGLSF